MDIIKNLPHNRNQSYYNQIMKNSFFNPITHAYMNTQHDTVNRELKQDFQWDSRVKDTRLLSQVKKQNEYIRYNRSNHDMKV